MLDLVSEETHTKKVKPKSIAIYVCVWLDVCVYMFVCIPLTNTNNLYMHFWEQSDTLTPTSVCIDFTDRNKTKSLVGDLDPR